MGTPSPDAHLYGDERSASGIQPGSAADFENSILNEMGLLIRVTYSIKFGDKKIIPYAKPSRTNIDGALDKFKRSGGNPTRFPEKMDRTEFEPNEKKGNKKNKSKSQDNDRDYKKHPKSKARID